MKSPNGVGLSDAKMPLHTMTSSSSSYVSCIKINNVPILAPLVTAEKRKELLAYRKQAIKVEGRIKKEKELKAIINHYSDLLDRTQVDDAVKEVEPKPNLTCNIQSSQFVNDKFSALESDLEVPPTPRLIRSNSYTLDTPSPALVEHLKQNVSRRQMISSTCSADCSDDESVKGEDTLKPEYFDDSILDTSCTETELRNLSHESQLNESNLKQFIDNNVPCEVLNVTNVTYITEPKPIYDSKLEDILKSIPEEYSKRIYELLEKQKCESNIYSRNNSVNSAEFDELRKKEEQFSTPINASDELYITAHEKQDESNENEKVEKAAQVITAAAKGFLVRRLFRTERVQGLINTIRDALLCAVQLHSENFEDINESDVELHRRLIQQVSAACYSFHDLFFNTSTQEKMYIISSDRELRKEKAKRPTSSSRSTPRSSSVRSN